MPEVPDVNKGGRRRWRCRFRRSRAGQALASTTVHALVSRETYTGGNSSSLRLGQRNCHPLGSIGRVAAGGILYGTAYQRGYLRFAARKSGLHCWEFLWRENDVWGKRERRTLFGTLEEYPTQEEALHAVNGLRMQINADRNRRPVQPISIKDLIDHYLQTELSPSADWHSHATRIVYRYFMKKWIQPHWGKTALVQYEPSPFRLAERLQRAEVPVGQPNEIKDPQSIQLAVQSRNPL